MDFLIIAGTFFTVLLTVYGLGYRTTAAGGMDERLGGLRYARPKREALPEPDAAFSVRVVQPIIRNLSVRANSMLPSNISERLAAALVQAGLTVKPGQFIVAVALLAGLFPLVMTVLMASAVGFPNILMFYGLFVALGVYGPRMWLLGKMGKRKKAIQKSLPDAFDLITASVEAGLGIDSALSGVIDKVSGPFAEELRRTTREISMGRSRADAFADLAQRTGVDDLRVLVNAIVQAEQMGISVGGVIRVQTGVMRTKRRQRAEEQAFKAPIKMVFPLVFFIFPAIFVVIGGPAALSMMEGF